MGGTVSVTIRKDGREFRMQRWTNGLPDFVNNDRLIEGSEDHLIKYLEQWILMKEDYELNKDTNEFELNNTDYYFPSYGLCPINYGLAVIDYDTKTILSMQGYCHFLQLYNAGIRLDKNDRSEFSRYKTFKRLVDKGYIKKAVGYTTSDLSELNFEDIEEGFLKHSSSSFDFPIESDWKAIYFNEDAKGARELKEKVLELGFVILEEEDKEWEDWIAEMEEEY